MSRSNLENHTRSHSLVSARVDEDKRASLAVLIVRIVEEGRGGAERDTADLVQGEITRVFFFTKGVDVHLVADLLDDRLRFFCGVANDEFSTKIKIGV